jgi:hypothetical protein
MNNATLAPDNTSVGSNSLTNINVGGRNSALGAYSIRDNTRSWNNTALGYEALKSCVGATAVGVYGLYDGSNTAVGYGCLSSLTTGVNNFAVGAASGADPLFMVVQNNNLGILGNNNTEAVYSKVPITVISDARDKTNFGQVPQGLEFVKKLKPISYQFKLSRDSEEASNIVRYGFKAQDIAAIEPEGIIVDSSDADKLRYNESNLIPILVKAIQELSDKNDALQARIQALESAA